MSEELFDRPPVAEEQRVERRQQVGQQLRGLVHPESHMLGERSDCKQEARQLLPRRTREEPN